MRPLIGITGRRWPLAYLGDQIPPALISASFDLHLAEYPAVIAAAGGLPVQLARDADVDEVVQRLDGVVISGGSDVDPSFYGHEPHPRLGATEPERDEWELAVITAAIRHGVPLLGICRGAQLLNVHLGGTLTQHVELHEGVGHPRFDDDRSERCHTVRLLRDTLAHRLYGDEVAVNSLHHQTINPDAPQGVASAFADDGVVEVIEVPGSDVFAVQWHPESLDGIDPSVAWLVERAAARAQRYGR